MPWPHYLNGVEHYRKVRERKEGTDRGKYSLLNTGIKNWNQLPAKALEAYTSKPKVFRRIVRIAIINMVKRNE